MGCVTEYEMGYVTLFITGSVMNCRAECDIRGVAIFVTVCVTESVLMRVKGCVIDRLSKGT